MPAAFDLTGRTAIVTGCATGNGRAIAIALAEAGVDSKYSASPPARGIVPPTLALLPLSLLTSDPLVSL